MGILAWIILGGVAGWIASMIAGADSKMGIPLNVVVGIVGAVLGGFIFNALGASGVTGFSLYSLFVATVGAAVLLFIVGMFNKKRASG